MFLFDKNKKVRFYYIVLPLCLAICLRVEGSKKLFLNTKKVKERRPKLRGENCFFVANGKVKKAIVLYYYTDNYFCKAWNINGDFKQLLVHYFG